MFWHIAKLSTSPASAKLQLCWAEISLISIESIPPIDPHPTRESILHVKSLLIEVRLRPTVFSKAFNSHSAMGSFNFNQPNDHQIKYTKTISDSQPEKTQFNIGNKNRLLLYMIIVNTMLDPFQTLQNSDSKILFSQNKPIWPKLFPQLDIIQPNLKHPKILSWLTQPKQDSE